MASARGKIPPMNPAKVRTFDIEGTPVRCVETDDGHRVDRGRLDRDATLREMITALKTDSE